MMIQFVPDEFWQYAYSNFIDNRNRAALAEFIVAKAVGVSNTPETSWESFDILSPEGIRIEVKCAGLLQSWKQKKLSTPSFDVKQTFGWVGETYEWDNILDRQAHVYVFCLHIDTEPKTANPLSSDSWRFYVVPTNLINQKLGGQKSVRVSTIENILGAKQIKFGELRNEILKNSRPL